MTFNIAVLKSAEKTLIMKAVLPFTLMALTEDQLTAAFVH